MKTEHDRRPHSMDIRLDALSDTEWRVCDRRVQKDDYLSILGFIEMRNRQFEVTRMAAPRDRLVFASLDEAREVFTLFDTERVHRG